MRITRHWGNKIEIWYDGNSVVLDLNSNDTYNPSHESVTFRSAPVSLIKALRVVEKIAPKPLDYLEFDEEEVKGRVGFMSSVDKFANYLIYVEISGRITSIVRVSREQLIEFIGMLLMLPGGDDL